MNMTARSALRIAIRNQAYQPPTSLPRIRECADWVVCGGAGSSQLPLSSPPPLVPPTSRPPHLPPPRPAAEQVGVATDTARRIRAEQAMAKYQDVDKLYDNLKL